MIYNMYLFFHIIEQYFFIFYILYLQQIKNTTLNPETITWPYYEQMDRAFGKETETDYEGKFADSSLNQSITNGNETRCINFFVVQDDKNCQVPQMHKWGQFVGVLRD